MYYNHIKSEDFEFFVKSVSKTQLKQMLKVSDAEEFIIFLTSSYNCYVIKHNLRSMSLITNPDILFFDDTEKKRFMNNFKQFIIEELKTREIKNANNSSIRTENQTTKN